MIKRYCDKCGKLIRNESDDGVWSGRVFRAGEWTFRMDGRLVKGSKLEWAKDVCVACVDAALAKAGLKATPFTSGSLTERARRPRKKRANGSPQESPTVAPGETGEVGR